MTIEPRTRSIRERLLALLGEAAAFDVPMARLTSLKVGGPADALVRPPTREALRAVLEIAADAELPVFVVGGGFNTLVRDVGLRGIVVPVVLDPLQERACTVSHTCNRNFNGCHRLSPSGLVLK